METLKYEVYTVAWLALLPIEAEAALGMLDKRHQGQFESVRGDDYIYVGGEINGHNVLVATWPAGQNYGIGAAAALATQVKSRFTNIWFALLVGVAAGLPNLSPTPPASRRDIRLGDVLVCVPEKLSSGIVQYDLGREMEDGFHLVGRQAETPALVRSAIGYIQLTKKRPFKVGNEFALHLAAFQRKADQDYSSSCPTQDEDKLFACSEQTTAPPVLIERTLRNESERTKVWYGNIGSGSALVRNPERRDELRDKYDLIGLEMEAAGIMNILPTGVIQGVCNYGDSHKNNSWHSYAAAVAAVYAKGILNSITPQAAKVQTKMKLPYLDASEQGRGAIKRSGVHVGVVDLVGDPVSPRVLATVREPKTPEFESLIIPESSLLDPHQTAGLKVAAADLKRDVISTWRHLMDSPSVTRHYGAQALDDTFWRTFCADQEFTRFDDPRRLSKKRQVGPSDIDQLVTDWARASPTYLQTRTFFTAVEGMVGLCPRHARSGDEIVLLRGGRLPFIVRREGGSKYYRLIGEAYVHGIMDGELINTQDRLEGMLGKTETDVDIWLI